MDSDGLSAVGPSQAASTWLPGAASAQGPVGGNSATTAAGAGSAASRAEGCSAKERVSLNGALIFGFNLVDCGQFLLAPEPAAAHGPPDADKCEQCKPSADNR